MRSHSTSSLPYLWLSALALACGSAKDENLYRVGEDEPYQDLLGSGDADSSAAEPELVLDPAAFPGAGASGAAAPLGPSLGPETRDDCHPDAAPAPATADVQKVCFYEADAPDVLAATIEQVVEIVGNSEWVHARLTLNPDFVDNTYGETAIGWSAEASVEPAPAPAPRDGERRMRMPRPPRDGHTFRDLVGSDHAEIQLLDGTGNIVLHFRLDYLSESPEAPSGYASLGVSGGEGRLITGQPEWILESTTSMDRNLNACGLSSFAESSPETDASYAPAPAAAEWDFRVAYEVWVDASAFGEAGFGSALIENVHASPSKAAGNTVTVEPAPCPGTPEEEPDPLPPVLLPR